MIFLSVIIAAALLKIVFFDRWFSSFSIFHSKTATVGNIRFDALISGIALS